MTYNYPYFSFPHFRRYYPNYYSNISPNINNPIINKPVKSTYPTFNSSVYSNTKNASIPYTSTHKEQEKKASTKRPSSSFSFLNNLLHQEDRNDDESYFEIFGIKLYYDDILIIFLIFFLYQEDVKDQYLFIALILLLLS